MNPRIHAKDNIIKRFYIPGGDGYSAFWRRDKSPIEVLELSKVLVSLRKISSQIGRNVGTVVWSGMDIKDGIALDPTPIMGKYPIPAFKTDIMVGRTIQLSYEKTEWSERYKQLSLSQLDLPDNYAYKFNLFFDMCEKVYTDLLSNVSVLGNYTERARLWEIKEKRKTFINPPTDIELYHLWWDMAADRKGLKYKEEYVDRSVGGLLERTNLEKFYKKPIRMLNSMVDKLRYECPRIAGVSERGSFRKELYLSVWPEILKQIRFWPTDRSDPFLLSDKYQDDIEKDDKKKKAVKATLISYADTIEKRIRKKAADYTEKVRSNVKNVDDVVRIKGNDVIMRARNKVDKRLLHNLQFILKSVAHRKTFYSRGLKSGKIDRRRLYRAPTTGTVFNHKKDLFRMVNNIVLLLDATGSMAEPNKWNQSEILIQTLFSALVNYNPHARLFAYNEVKNICHLTELYMNGIFYTVLPHGQTASGEAIIATALKLKSTQKKPLLIHITDGASNWGCGVGDAIKFCTKRKINLLTLGVGCSPGAKDALKKEYGNLLQFLDKTDDLPNLLRKLLNYSKWN
ncbi:hypothetical protein DSCO28_00380 [Desulfosarcina ovata subsp. sediminis]|uniref:VWFA domain-containing protein n=1 Tax=Desulfosarcina ovata subsp. sediminis TaxID=885957 RepID=A0A5K7ZBY2_9BACT|nr:vWA domain-containing protein [Desulfosarcina ovata]BBO79472.1 hypothetical protein DSCO28_00380 [Desulfosarcina ovata subsp. sediminis]